MTLLDWTESYLRHRDLFEQKISSVEKEESGLLVRNKDGSTTHCLVKESLEGVTLPEGKVFLVTRNTRTNLEVLLRDWQRFVAAEGLKVIFVNEAANEKWILNPSSHARIAEEESLVQGLRTMFSEVAEG